MNKRKWKQEEVYSYKKEISFDVLKSFTFPDFKSICYGNADDQFYFVFGNLDNKKPENKSFILNYVGILTMILLTILLTLLLVKRIK